MIHRESEWVLYRNRLWSDLPCIRSDVWMTSDLCLQCLLSFALLFLLKLNSTSNNTNFLQDHHLPEGAENVTSKLWLFLCSLWEESFPRLPVLWTSPVTSMFRNVRYRGGFTKERLFCYLLTSSIQLVTRWFQFVTFIRANIWATQVLLFNFHFWHTPPCFKAEDLV